jgi:hypothetical protein
VIALLLIAAALLWIPALRHGCGSMLFGAMALVSMTLLFGEAGALVALAAGLAAFVSGFYRR